MGIIRKLNRHGDEETYWDENDAAQLQTAQSILADHVRNGGLAFEVTNLLGDAVIVRKFNRKATEIILAPRLMGG